MTYSLAELMVCAASRVFDRDGEVLATGIGLLPRLAASLAMRTSNPDMMMTDSQSFVLSSPNPVSGLASHDGQANENWMGFARIFDNVWSGARHALVGPSQIDRFGQTNISALGGTYQQPKVQLLGMRGFPGNSISHANSFFVPQHSTRVFVAGECDVVCSIGYNPERLPRGLSTWGYRHQVGDYQSLCHGLFGRQPPDARGQFASGSHVRRGFATIPGSMLQSRMVW